MKKIIVAFGMVLATAFACFAASPASDFEYHRMSESELTDLSRYVNGLDAKGGFIEIDKYKGGDSTVEIPAEIEECKVIKVTVDDSSKKYVVPASVIWFHTTCQNHEMPVIEFLRPKDAAFFWQTKVLPTEKKLRDRKIIFVPSTEAKRALYLPDVETFTWSKNWSTCTHPDVDKPVYNNSDWIVLFCNWPPIDELIIEEGIQELPFCVYACCEKLVLPKSLKTIRNPSTIIVDYTIEDIVIPAGSKIKIKPYAISGAEDLSRSTRNTLDALGYDW